MSETTVFNDWKNACKQCRFTDFCRNKIDGMNKLWCYEFEL